MALAFPSHADITMEELHNVVIWDLGSRDHNFNDLKWFEEYEAFDNPTIMLTAGGPGIRLGKGKVRLLTTDNKGNLTELAFDDAYYSPNTPLNIISVRKLKGHVQLDSDREIIVHKVIGRVVATAK